MKIRIDRIVISPFSLREKIDEEYLKNIANSLKEDGQWNPIIVRQTPDGRYELISGEYRVRAARMLGWNEIEATVQDIDNFEASLLALKTNLIRRNMDPIEEARAIQNIMQEYELTQKEVGSKLGMSPDWVGHRLALVLRIIDEVQEALIEGKISIDHSVLISRLTIQKEVIKEGKKVIKISPDEKKQRIFLRKIIEDGLLSRDEAREVLKWLQNDTIYTIGYEGMSLDKFIKILQENKIDVLVDIRKSGRSQYKAEFNEDILEREFRDTRIAYERRPDLGVIYDVRMPYIEGWLSDACFEQWYKWSIRGRRTEGKIQDLLPILVKDYKSRGKVCLMCEERYPQPTGSQKHYCHRNTLAEMILGYEDEKEPLMRFENRVDL